MSSSSEFADSGRFTGGQRAPEKSNFAQTCNLLSQYLKENKATFGDFNLGGGGGGGGTGITTTTTTRSFHPFPIPFSFPYNNGNGNGTSNASTTMNLFPVTQRSGEILGVPALAGNGTMISLFPQLATFPPSTGTSTASSFSPCHKEEQQQVLNNTDSSVNKSEPVTAQMTIFYGGQVIVFDDLAEDKAKEVMVLAAKAGSQFTSTLLQKPVESADNSTPIVVPKELVQVQPPPPPPPPQPIVTALPIARKASLTRFLEKRKDRITARAPYQTSNSAATPFKPVESKSWLGLAAQSPLQFQLQL